MTHDHTKGRGILDRSATLLKVPLAKSMSYNEALDQAVKCVYGEQSLDTTYYLADSSGAIIGSSDTNFTVPGENTIIPWTVGNYMAMSHSRYASKTRLYCVQKRGKFSSLIMTLLIMAARLLQG